jgi:hypothetical protein
MRIISAGIVNVKPGDFFDWHTHDDLDSSTAIYGIFLYLHQYRIDVQSLALVKMPKKHSISLLVD